MRSRLPARSAALILAAGGMLVIPASPASAHCGANDHLHPDMYNNGGIDWSPSGTPVKRGPHTDCNVIADISPVAGIDVLCAQQVPDNTDDWVHINPGPPLILDGKVWARESNLNVFDGERYVARCADSGFVHITQNP